MSFRLIYFLEKSKLVLLVIAASLAFMLFPFQVQALTLQSRSISLSTGVVSATAVHNIQFTLPSTSAIGSIVFQYCSNTALLSAPCTAPAGLDLTGATLNSQTGNTGFIIHAPGTTANRLVLSRPPSGGLAVASSYTFGNVINPSTANATTYVRITTHATANGSGSTNDSGAVAFAATSPFAVNTFVPPFLRICVGITVAMDCTSASGNDLDLGILSTQSTRSGTSQFSVGTNSITGYIVSVLGTTMTSGNKTIPAINPAGGSQTGTGQFGINLKSNTTPSVGAEPQGSGSGTPQGGYNVANIFKFQSGDAIAAASLPSEFNRMTVSYVVNINTAQPAGVYNTTLTYLGTAQF